MKEWVHAQMVSVYFLSRYKNGVMAVCKNQTSWTTAVKNETKNDGVNGTFDSHDTKA
jgi:hypothetical protein